MPTQSTSNPSTSETPPAALQEAAANGRLAWQRLGLRLRSITPAALLRGLLVALFFGALIWLIWRAGLSLLPFWVGLVVAYVTLPFVNWLDRFIPRVVAVLLLLTMEVAVLALIVLVVTPIFLDEAVRLYGALPTWGQVQSWWFDLERYLKTLPLPVQDFLDGWLRNAYNNARLNFTETLTQAVSAGTLAAINVARVVTFLLSFLIIPTWLVSVLNDQRQVRRGLDSALPAPVRADFWAVLRIFDRTFNAFVRGRLVIATLVGVLIFLGLQVFPSMAAEELPFPLAMATIAGLFNLVPIVGTIVGAIPLVLLALAISWQLALAVLVLYILVIWVVALFVAPWLESMAVDIHPAVLAPIVILGTTFGVVGAVLAGPLAVVTRDLVRYAYGRLGEPPRPAGLLPGEPLPVPPPAPRVRGRVRPLVMERR